MPRKKPQAKATKEQKPKVKEEKLPTKKSPKGKKK